MSKYFLVTTKCGHVGRSGFVPITFPIRAVNGREAAKIARCIPRVKHHHWDAIINCVEVNIEEYMIQVSINQTDPYLTVQTKREQNIIMDQILDRMVVDNHVEEIELSRKRSKKPNLFFQSKKYKTDCIDYQYVA